MGGWRGTWQVSGGIGAVECHPQHISALPTNPTTYSPLQNPTEPPQPPFVVLGLSRGRAFGTSPTLEAARGRGEGGGGAVGWEGDGGCGGVVREGEVQDGREV